MMVKDRQPLHTVYDESCSLCSDRSCIVCCKTSRVANSCAPATTFVCNFYAVVQFTTRRPVV